MHTSAGGSFSKSSTCLLGFRELIIATGLPSFDPTEEEIGAVTAVLRGYGLLGFLLGRGGGMSMS